MPAGWRSTIVEFWPDASTFFNRNPLQQGEIAVVQVLSPDAPDPTQAQLDAFEATFARYGGVANARVVERFWFGYPILTPEQMRAAAGIE